MIYIKLDVMMNLTITRNGPDDPIHGYRLVADDGKLLTRGGEYVYCVDVEPSEVNQWREVNASYA